ncbi:MAG TPA: hypothetical protein VIK99_05760 [Thermaerobacter sp.]
MNRSGARWMVILALAGAVAAGAAVVASARPEGGSDLDAATGREAVLREVGPGVSWPEVRVIRVPAEPRFAGGDRRHGEDWDCDAHEDHEEHGRDDDERGWHYDEDDDE